MEPGFITDYSGQDILLLLICTRSYDALSAALQSLTNVRTFRTCRRRLQAGKSLGARSRCNDCIPGRSAGTSILIGLACVRRISALCISLNSLANILACGTLVGIV